jgi:hypothetical protein
MRLTDPKTLHCQCGCEDYRIKWTLQEKWAVCADCGRPTRIIGDGLEKQLEWQEENDE